MAVPGVNFTVLNRRLGVRPPTQNVVDAYVGSASAGPVNTPQLFSRQSQLTATFPSGPAVELAIGAIENYGDSVVFCRATDNVTSSFGTLVVSGVTGTSVVTRDAAASSDDDYLPQVEVVTGGTIGSASPPITLAYSLDGGDTFSAPVPLGTANTFTIPGTGSPGIKYDLAAGTLIAGDIWTDQANAPQWDSVSLPLALAALQASNLPWENVWIEGSMSAAQAALVTTFLNSIEFATGRAVKAYCRVRMPTLSEGDATYQASVGTAFASFADNRITMAAAACRHVSEKVGRGLNFRRSALFAISGLPQSLPFGVDMSQRVDATPQGLPGTTLYSATGAPREHDEMITPGLDNLRFLALRSWPDKQGVYVNNPTTLEVSGGDWHLDQFVRIRDEFCNVTRSVLLDELSRELDLNLQTNGINKAGAATEYELQRIERRVIAALKVSRLAGQVTSVSFALHRDDILLSTQTLNGDGGVVFRGYPKQVNFTVAAINPAAA